MDWTLEMEYVRTVFESCVATHAQLNPRGTVVGRDGVVTARGVVCTATSLFAQHAMCVYSATGPTADVVHMHSYIATNITL